MTHADALAWLEQHGYRDMSDGVDGWLAFTDDVDEKMMGYHYCKTERDVVELVEHLALQIEV